MTAAQRQRRIASWFVAVLGSALTLAALVSERARMLAVLLGVLSLVTLVAYGADKSAARKGTWRTPERTLHVLSLAGGWPGALLGQHWFRHKTKKASFQLIFRMTVVLNVVLCTYFLTPQGSDRLIEWLNRL